MHTLASWRGIPHPGLPLAGRCLPVLSSQGKPTWLSPLLGPKENSEGLTCAGAAGRKPVSWQRSGAFCHSAETQPAPQPPAAVLIHYPPPPGTRNLSLPGDERAQHPPQPVGGRNPLCPTSLTLLILLHPKMLVVVSVMYSNLFHQTHVDYRPHKLLVARPVEYSPDTQQLLWVHSLRQLT